jgi:hypothetical protein
MLQKAIDCFCRGGDDVIDHDEAVASMTKSGTVKPKIACEKRRATFPVQISQNFLHVVPLGAAYADADLPETYSMFPELLSLGPWDIVVENDQAAELRLELISFTRPRLVSDSASRTAAGRKRFRYSFTISSGERPAAANSSTSLTAIRVPLKIRRPR